MIYLIIGPSCAGKSSFTVNTFIRDQKCREYKDLITVCENDSCFLIGKYLVDNRTKGTDRVYRKDIPKILDQVKRLIPKGKDIVLEGDKICSEPLFTALEQTGEPCKLYWIRCTPETSIARNRKNNSTCSDRYLKTVGSKARNLFWKFYTAFDGEIIDTDEITDFKNFSLETATTIKPAQKNSTRKIRDDFAVFILTHGRADNVVTLKALEKGGYTGKIYFIIDDEDEQRDLYIKNFGADRVVVFDKQQAYDNTDTMDNFNDHRAIIYARNESWRIAKKLGLTYFLMLDDDYKSIDYRYADGKALRYKAVKDFDRVFEDMLDFLDVSGADTVAFAQGGDFVGGLKGGNFKKGLLRKAMNSFFCRTDKPIQFKGTMNEDVVTYTTMSSRGHLFLTFTSFAVIQLPTQSLKGGMTDAYKEGGTYLKSFYAVMSMPSAVKVDMMRTKHQRMHHKVNWNCTAPKILNEKWRKT